MDNRSSARRVSCPLESVSTTFQSLDTVRALHQTVVSLRAALEEAKSEIQRLRSQIRTQTEIKDSIKFHEKEENLSQIRSSINNSKNNDVECKTILLESLPVSEKERSELKINSNKDLVKTSKIEVESPSTSSLSPSEIQETEKDNEKQSKILVVPDINVVAYPTKGKLKKMASKIDVKIKVMSKVNVDGSKTDTSSSNQLHSEKKEEITNQIEVETTTKDSVEIKTDHYGTYKITQSSKEDFNAEEKSSSQSDSGDVSILFEETSKEYDENKSKQNKKIEKNPEIREEVDDIELIFSSEENREPIQEDLVSISEYYPWQTTTGGSGTPVLVKFSSLTSDQDSGHQSNKPIKIPISTTCDSFYEIDKVTFGQNKNLENQENEDIQITNKSLKVEKELDETDKETKNQSIGRDESLDFFDNRDLGGVGRKWTNYNVLVETDISKCGIIEETTFEVHRRNTCPNPLAYRPLVTKHVPSRFLTKYCRSGQYGPSNNSGFIGPTTSDDKFGPKRNSSAQTNISALPDYWKSESQLTGHRYQAGGQCTLPSKFVPTAKIGCPKHTLRISERTLEARRILLSDINFTSMVPELSRSADHLCQDERRQEQINKQASRYYKGNLLKTPDYALKGLTPSASMTSPGVSQWTVNGSSFGTQTIQTGESWIKRGDSFESYRSYSTDSRCSGLNRHHRSRSVPSIRCVICKQAHTSGQGGIRNSESMNYTPRVTFQDPTCKVRGSLPDLRHDCACSRRYASRHMFSDHRDSSGSTESLLDEADAFVRKSMDNNSLLAEDSTAKRPNLRRMSENDIQREFTPSKQSLPFLPKTANCLIPGHIAKVISKNGRVVVGRVRYVGPLISNLKSDMHDLDDIYVGIQLQNKFGDCDGTYEGRKIFDCEPLQGLFVPFKKVVMAWSG